MKRLKDKPLSNNAMSHMLASASSALAHGRIRTAVTKVAEVHAELNSNRTIRDEMKRRFPWLGTEEDAGSGADVISELAEWYDELTTGKESQS